MQPWSRQLSQANGDDLSSFLGLFSLTVFDFRIPWHRILIGLQNFFPLFFVHDQPGLLMLEHMILCHCVSKLKNLSICTASPFVVEYLFISLFDFICFLCVDMFHFCVLEGKCLCLYSNSFSIRTMQFSISLVHCWLWSSPLAGVHSESLMTPEGHWHCREEMNMVLISPNRR